ncbi:MAG: DUF4491 family protein [Prevotella sp.]|nr:DUF4491 family protein [Prevotella sp.]
MYFTGFIIAISTFLIIGLFHPIVIKTEYYFGTRPWWIFLISGIVCIVCSLLIEDAIFSSIIGVIGASFLWSIGELFSQKKRVQKGWFPVNPKRKDEYPPLQQDASVCPVRNGKPQKGYEDRTYIHREDAE